MTDENERARAHLENGLAFLAGVRKRLELFDLRLNQLERRTNLSSLIDPAREDVGVIREQLRNAQRIFGGVWASEWGNETSDLGADRMSGGDECGGHSSGG